MTQKKVTLEIKVGFLVVSGIVLLVVFLFAIGDLTTYFQPGYRLKVIFDSANGIGRGSPVQYAGVEVGKVEDVRIVYIDQKVAPRVELLVRLPSSVQIHSNDEARISTFGLLGEKYLELVPGDEVGATLKSGDMLAGQPTISTEKIIERSNEVLSEFKQTLEGLNNMVGDPEARMYLKETLQEARDATRNWRLLGERLNLAMSSMEAGQGSVGKLVYDDTLYKKVESFVEDIQQHPWKLLMKGKVKDAKEIGGKDQSASAK
jgi:phospholipid/cholesterol/gamma-HCH transport system substrate-binding protein